MTRDLLERLADEMPPARLPADLWASGRRRRRNRRLGYAALAVAVLLLAAGLPQVATHRDASVMPAGSQPAVPSRVYLPHFWQAEASQWPAGPPGPSGLVFFTGQTRYFEDTGVAVGFDGSYRLIYQDPGESEGMLSPDGRTFVKQGMVLLDLATGDERQLSGEPIPGRPLAWSPDGTELLLGVSNDDDGVQYGDNGVPVADPEKADDLVAVDVTTGESRFVRVGGFNSYRHAAWSPDGNQIIIEGPVGRGDTGRRMSVVDAETGSPLWTAELDPHRQLAGRGAWQPGGSRVALLAFDGCTGACDVTAEAARRWRVEFFDPLMGGPVGEAIPLDGVPGEVIGWRDGHELLMTYAPDRGAPRHRVLAAVRPDATIETVIDTPAGVTNLEIAADVVRAGAFGGPAHRPSPWAAAGWAYAAVAVPVLLVAFWVWRRRARIVARARKATPTTNARR